MEQFNLGPAAEEAEVNASADNVGMVFNLNEVEEQSSSLRFYLKVLIMQLWRSLNLQLHSHLDLR